MPDIDIDFANRNILLDKIEHRVARMNSEKKHNTGIYATECPHNPVDNLATIDYKAAEDRGYFKLDFLNVSIYSEIKSEEHLQQLMRKEPLWELLEHKDFVDKVFHLSGHDKLLKQLKPTSVEHLAATLAIIRPAKRYLANESWATIMKEVWTKPEDGEYYFKKAHAVAYAISCVVHMNIICDQANELASA